MFENMTPEEIKEKKVKLKTMKLIAWAGLLAMRASAENSNKNRRVTPAFFLFFDENHYQRQISEDTMGASCNFAML